MDEQIEELKEQTGKLATSQLEREIIAIQSIKEIIDELGGGFSHVGAALKGFSELAYHNIEAKSYDTPFYYEERAELLEALDKWRDRADQLLVSRDSIIEYYQEKAKACKARLDESIEDNERLSEQYRKSQALMDFIRELE